MSKVKVNLSDETTGESGILEFRRVSIKELREITSKTADVQTNAELLDMKIAKLKEMYNNASTLKEMEDLEAKIKETSELKSTSSTKSIDTNMAVIKELFVDGEIDGKKVTKENLEELVSATALAQISEAISGGLANKT